MRILITMLGAFALSVLLGKVFVPMLRALKAGQSIREVGPKWHSGKQGTPTMGGLIFISASLLCLVTGFRGMLRGDLACLFVLLLFNLLLILILICSVVISATATCQSECC